MIALALAASAVGIAGTGAASAGTIDANANLVGPWSWSIEYDGQGTERNVPTFQVFGPVAVVQDPGVTISKSQQTSPCVPLQSTAICAAAGSSLLGSITGQSPMLIRVALWRGDDVLVAPALNADWFVFESAGNDIDDVSRTKSATVFADNNGHEPDGSDVITGNAQTTMAYNFRSAGVSVSLDGIANDGSPGEGDNVTGVGTIIGTFSNDTLIGDDNANTINGEGGADHIDGRGGDDTIYEGSPAGSVVCGAGNDHVYAPAGTTIAPDCETVTITP